MTIMTQCFVTAFVLSLTRVIYQSDTYLCGGKIWDAPTKVTFCGSVNVAGFENLIVSTSITQGLSGNVVCLKNGHRVL